jgi:pyrimidine operon attenuation protein/uracil phosphoribosyltransferase
MKTLLSAPQVGRAIDRLYQAVADHLPSDQPVAIIGIRTRGEVLARRLVERLQTQTGKTFDYGVLDITFYRDDLSLRKGVPLVRATEITFDLDDKVVLLIDDVLATGRSVRAALDALVDFGRPKCIRLAVLIDRGGRELPIAADYVGAAVKAANTDSVKVKLQECDGADGVFLVKSGKAAK